MVDSFETSSSINHARSGQNEPGGWHPYQSSEIRGEVLSTLSEVAKAKETALVAEVFPPGNVPPKAKSLNNWKAVIKVPAALKQEAIETLPGHYYIDVLPDSRVRELLGAA